MTIAANMGALCDLTLELVRLADAREPMSLVQIREYAAETLGALIEAVRIEAATNTDLGLPHPASPALEIPGARALLDELNAFERQAYRANGAQMPGDENL